MNKYNGGNRGYSPQNQFNKSSEKYSASQNFEKPKAFAPYNFVPFADQPKLAYNDGSELPFHNQINQSLKSGELHITITAKTPIYVANGMGKEGDGSNADFYKNANGHYAIPGSTVRGLLRENVQILGSGGVALGNEIDDKTFFYRKVGVKLENNDRYKQILNISYDPKTRTNSAKAVKAGILYYDGNEYVIRCSENFYSENRFKEDIPFTENDFYYDGNPTQYKLIVPGPAPSKNNCVYTVSCKTIGKPIVINKSVIDAYKEDLDIRSAAFSDDENGTKDDKLKYFSLPNVGERRAFFYIEDGKGNVAYLGKSPFMRIGYRNAISKGLKYKIKNDDDPVLDYPNSIFGFINDKYSYKSRVSFEDFELSGKAEHYAPIDITLATPKPSYANTYTENGDYNSDDFQLRGYKQYWMKDVDAESNTAANQNMKSAFKPLKENSVFKGVIRFKNLTDDELGLLLWAIEGPAYQPIGGGKPYGYGRTVFDLNKFIVYDYDDLYSENGLCANMKPKSQEERTEYIKKYQHKVGYPGNNKITEMIEDFLYIRRADYKKPSKSETQYMKIPKSGEKGKNEFLNRSPMPNISEFRKNK